MIERYLSDVGFDSCDHAWTEQQAVDFAASRFPQLIIVGDDLETGSGIAAAERISDAGPVAIWRVTAERLHRHKEQLDNPSLQGSQLIDQIESTVSGARSARSATSNQLNP